MGSSTGSSDVYSVMQGEDKIFMLYVTQVISKLPQSLDNTSIYFTVKARYEDVVPLILKRNAAAGGDDTEIFVMTPQSTSANTGKACVYLEPEDTDKLIPGLRYVMDAWIVLQTGERRPVLRQRRIEVTPRVTWIP